MKNLVDREILQIAKKVMSGTEVEDIVQEFESGNFPILDNLHQQLALISLTEDLAEHIFIEQQFISEALKTGRIVRKDDIPPVAYLILSHKCTLL